MKKMTYILITCLGILIVLAGAYLFVRNQYKGVPVPRGSKHASLPWEGEGKIEFDYPIFKGWKATVENDMLTYKPNFLYMVVRSVLAPAAVVRISYVDYDEPRDWSGYPVNDFAVRYEVKANSVEFDDGMGGGITFVPMMNSMPDGLSYRPIIDMITKTFDIKTQHEQTTSMPEVDEDLLRRSDVLLKALAVHDGTEINLGPGEKIAYGGGTLEFDVEKEELVVGIFVTRTWWSSATEEHKENFRKSLVGLNDPKIGGMYERAGGYFVFDEEKGYYLTRVFPIVATVPEDFVESVEYMRQVVPRWTTQWFFEVSQITHGHRPAPTERIEYAPKD